MLIGLLLMVSLFRDLDGRIFLPNFLQDDFFRNRVGLPFYRFK